MNLDEYNVLIFDCDGVIFDTTQLKLEAFKDALSGFDYKYIEKFSDYFMMNFGRSRYVHVRHFIENILKIPLRPSLYDQIILDYGSLCLEIYDGAKMCEGVLELLERSNNSKKYIASGSDQSELRSVFANRGLDYFFKVIYGSPRAKNDIVSEICSKHQDEKILMIGDAEADYLASEKAGIDFLFIERYSADKANMKILAATKGFKTLWDFSDLSLGIVRET